MRLFKYFLGAGLLLLISWSTLAQHAELIESTTTQSIKPTTPYVVNDAGKLTLEGSWTIDYSSDGSWYSVAQNFGHSPDNGAILADDVINITFNEAIDQATIGSGLAVTDHASQTIAGVWTQSGSTLTFTPNTLFSAYDEVTVNINTSLLGSSGSWFPIDYEWSFDINRTIKSPVPNDLIATNSNVDLEFPSMIDLTTAASGISVYGSRSGGISGVWSSSGNVLTFNPTHDFFPGEEVEFTILDGLQSSAGNFDPVNETWQYMVMPQPSTPTFNLNDGALSQSTGTILAGPLTFFPEHITTADLDVDGDQDLMIFSDGTNGGIRTIENLGSGSFASPILVKAASNTNDHVEGYSLDVDSNGYPDVVAVMDGEVQVFENDGFGNLTYTSSFTYTIPGRISEAVDLDTLDFNGDGKFDLYVGFNLYTVSPYKAYAYYVRYENLGNGTFSEDNVIQDVDWTITELKVAENNKPVSISFYPTNYYVRPSDPDIPGPLIDIYGGRNLALGDIDGDGDDDVIFDGNQGYWVGGTLTSYPFAWFENDGSGTGARHELGAWGFDLLDHLDQDNQLDLLMNGKYFKNGQHRFNDRRSIINANFTMTSSDLDQDTHKELIQVSNSGIEWNELHFNQSGLVSGFDGSVVEISDLDQDQTLEMISYQVSDNNLYLYVDSGSDFEISTNISTLSYMDELVLEDLDGDGDLDILVYHTESNASIHVGYHLVHATNNISSLNTITSDRIGSLTSADIDGDGDIDIITSIPSSIQVRSNDGTGNFSSAQSLIDNLSGSAKSLKMGDIDQDGDLDIIMNIKGTNNEVYKVTNDDGTYQESLITTIGTINNATVDKLSLRDIDGDHDLDLIATIAADPGASENKVIYLTNNGKGIFSLASDIVNDTRIPRSLDINDVDGDGDLDIIISLVDSGGSSSTSLFTNNGLGSFSETIITTDGKPRNIESIYSSDINYDGFMDIIVVDSENSTIGWYDNLNGSSRVAANDNSQTVSSSTVHSAIPILTEKEGLSIYPNPVKDRLMVQIDHFEFAHVSILDLSGKVLVKPIPLQQKQTELDVSGISKSIFILKVDLPGESHTIKLFKSK